MEISASRVFHLRDQTMYRKQEEILEGSTRIIQQQLSKEWDIIFTDAAYLAEGAAVAGLSQRALPDQPA